MPGNEQLIINERLLYFSHRLIRSNDLNKVLSLYKDVKSMYAFDNFEMPLSSRLLEKPNVTQNSFGWRSINASVIILALTSLGRIEQLISLVCESDFWKVDSLSYGPPT